MAAKNFKVVHTGVGPWRKGDVVSTDHIENLQGNIENESDKQRTARNNEAVKRLVDTGAVEETDDDVRIEGLEPGAGNLPEQTKGDNVDFGSDDDVHKRAKRRHKAVGPGNTGMPAPEGAGSEDEPQFAGKPLSYWDQFPDQASLEAQEGIGEHKAKDILHARAKRDRAAAK